MTLKQAFKHLFIPHKHNDYKPHFFRELSVFIIVVASVFLLGVSAGSSFLIHKTVLGANVTADVLVDLTNESRVANNDAPLMRNSVLDEAATMKADDMSTYQYFAHTSPTGVTPWHWFEKAGYHFLYAGENLAINFTDATEVRDAWLASPTHRANLLDVKFKEIGMATVDGVYKDGPTIYIVQLFGTPAVERVQAAVPSATTTITTTSEARVKTASTSPSTASSTILAINNPPEIKGESTSTPKPKFEPILDTKELAVVKNTDAVAAQTVATPAQMVQYAPWYERLIFGGTYYVGIIFRIFLGIVLVALITMLVIEIRKQHWKHIAYGLALMLILSLCIIINQAFW